MPGCNKRCLCDSSCLGDKSTKRKGGASWTDKHNGGGGEGPPTQEHQRTPPTRETPLGVRAIDAALKNIKNDLPGNNGRAGDDMMATAMIGGGCGCYFGCKLLQGKRSEQKKAGGGGE